MTGERYAQLGMTLFNTPGIQSFGPATEQQLLTHAKQVTALAKEKQHTDPQMAHDLLLYVNACILVSQVMFAHNSAALMTLSKLVEPQAGPT